MNIRHKYYFASLVVIAILLRVVLAGYVPIWPSDEGHSYWSAGWYGSNEFGFAINNPADYAHPSGYYVILSLLRYFSDNLVFLRISSVVFSAMTMYFLWLIGKKYRSSLYASVLVISYGFSGYFLVTDWMIRGYALSGFLIIFSLFLYLNFDEMANYKYSLLWLVHTLGLYNVSSIPFRRH